MLLIFSAAQNRFCANGKSRLTVKHATLSFMAPIASSNFFVCALHTGVSNDGTTLNMRAFAGVLASVTTSNGLVAHANSGALSPALSWGPTKVSIESLNFTALGRFVMV